MCHTCTINKCHMRMYIQTYIHTYIHTYIYIYIHTYSSLSPAMEVSLIITSAGKTKSLDNIGVGGR